MKIAVFGSTGMLGWYIVKYFQKKHDITCITRTDFDIHNDNLSKLQKVLDEIQPDLVINCTNCHHGNTLQQIDVHGRFPHMLDKVLDNTTIPWLQVSTNCVFNGTTGLYVETDTPNATSMYGITKALGETLQNAMVLRVSIIGESDTNTSCLLEWMKQRAGSEINGYTKYYWNGITCLEFARYIDYLICNNIITKGVYHVAPNYTVSKHDLLQMINNIYSLNIKITPYDESHSDLTLKSIHQNNFQFLDLYTQIQLQRVFRCVESKSKGLYKILTNCRLCNNPTVDILHLGDEYGIAGGFLQTKDECSEENTYPLTLSFCPKCSYMQCKQVIDPQQLSHKPYFYYSSMIPSLVQHFGQLSKWIESKFTEKGKDLKIIEIGCNDGVLLKQLQAIGYKTLVGVDPSQTIDSIQKNTGIHVYKSCFNKDIADTIVREHGKMNLFISCNSFAHIDDMKDVILAMKHVLDHEGVAIIEVHDSTGIFEKHQFDFIYHEHMGYYTITSVYNMCKSHGMTLINVEKIQNYGGSIRCEIRMGTTHDVSDYVIQQLDLEKKYLCPEYFNGYDSHIKHWISKMQNTFLDYRKKGYKIYAYGASGRANTIIRLCELTFDGLLDDAKSKIGCFTPVINTPIVESDTLYNTDICNPKNTCVFILAWTYAEGIINKHNKFIENGGTFVIPLPNIKIIDA